MSVNDSEHHEIRAAKFSIDRNPDEGVTLCVEAGELRLRFYIDGQWSDLVHQIYAGEGELGEMVPFRMKPMPVSALEPIEDDGDDESEVVISTSTIGAHPIPGLSSENPVYETPLWRDAFPSLRSQGEENDSSE